MFSAIILAAGSSKRFGSPKALASVDGVPAINVLLSNLLRIEDLEIIIVLGAHAERIQPVLLKHTTAHIVHNKDHNFGQTSSVQCGIRAAHADSRGFLMLPVDCPLVKGNTISDIIATFCHGGSELIIPAYKGRKGHPPLFSAKCRSGILGLDTSQGLNSYQETLGDRTRILDCDDEGVVLTFNTHDELEDMKRRSGVT